MELLLPYAAKHLVSHPFSRRLQELLLVALQSPEKAVVYRQPFFAAVRARDFAIHIRVAIRRMFTKKTYNK